MLSRHLALTILLPYALSRPPMICMVFNGMGTRGKGGEREERGEGGGKGRGWREGERGEEREEAGRKGKRGEGREEGGGEIMIRLFIERVGYVCISSLHYRLYCRVRIIGYRIIGRFLVLYVVYLLMANPDTSICINGVHKRVCIIRSVLIDGVVYLLMANPGTSMCPSHTRQGPSTPSSYSTANTRPPGGRNMWKVG